VTAGFFFRTCMGLTAAILLTVATHSAAAYTPPGKTPVVGSLRFAGDPDTDRFAVKLQGEWNTLPLMSAFVMPGEELLLETVAPESEITVHAVAGTTTRRGETLWCWRAPDAPGLHPLIITDGVTGRNMCIQVFVLTPYSGERLLNGYRIGRYERLPLKGDAAYNMPEGLIEVTPENKNTLVSPHFRLEQFLCKQSSAYPKYIALRPALLQKLEALQASYSERFRKPVTLHVMSAYRTPHYNAGIGNTTRYSRHLYGDAADVFVDGDGNDVMDDLDENGRVDVHDAGLLFGLVEELDGDHEHRAGGLGIYGRRPNHGPFVHVDTRGTSAPRWGDDRGTRWLRAYQASRLAEE